jgi:DNA-binding IclR family transcriptional regulator
MLAHLGQKQLIATFGSGELSKRTPLGPKTLRELTSLLATETKSGFALEVDEVTLGYASVGVAILDRLNHPIAGLAITLQSQELEKLQLDQLALALSRAADELSGRFGHSG